MHQQLKDILTSAVEGPAIAHWAKAKDIYREDESPNYVISFKVADNDPDGNGVAKKGWKVISEKTLLKAREKLVNEDVGFHRTVAAQFVGPIDKWEVDSNGVDAIIQVAFFGEVIYG